MSMSVHEYNLTVFYGLNTMEDKNTDNTPFFKSKSELYKWNGLKIAQWFPVTSIISSIYQVIDGGKNIILNPKMPIIVKIAFIARLILSIAAPILFFIDMAIMGIRKCLQAKNESTNNQRNNNNDMQFRDTAPKFVHENHQGNNYNDMQFRDLDLKIVNVDPQKQNNNNDTLLDLAPNFEDEDFQDQNINNDTQITDIEDENFQNHLV